MSRNEEIAVEPPWNEEIAETLNRNTKLKNIIAKFPKPMYDDI